MKKKEMELIDDLQKAVNEAFEEYRRKMKDAEKIGVYRKIMQTNPYFKRPFVRRWIKKIGDLSIKDG